jgi:hypothetical protein
MKRRTWFTASSLGFAVSLVVLLGISGAVPPNTPGPQTLYIDNAARSSTPNVQVVGLYGAVGSGNVLLVNDHDQGYNANAQIPITAPSGEKAEVITGVFQTILPNGNVHDINIPRPVQNQFTAGSTTQTASLMDWGGVLNQVSLVNTRAGVTPVVVNGNLTLNADGSISITGASGTTTFNVQNWNDSSNPLRQVLSWDGSRFHLDLNSTDTIIVNGYNVSGSTAAESRGLDIRANLTYEGVGAFVVNVATGMEQRGIQFEGQAKDGSGAGTGSSVSVLASQEGDGLAFVTNGRVYLNQEANFVPTVQGFLYAQGYRDGNGQPKGIDIVGGNLQGMAVGSRVYISSVNSSSGIVTDRIMINGAQTTMTIPPQMPGGRPVYTAAVSNWREAR